MSGRWFWVSRAARLVAFLVGPAILANAQFRASLRGTVTDAQGAPLANAIVTLTANATNEKAVTTSDANGMYEFDGLGPAAYSLTVGHEGFRTMVFNDVEIIPEQFNAQDVQLEVDESG